MKIKIIISALVFSTLNLIGAPVTDELIDALIQVESSGNPKAKGDYSKKTKKYQALGVLQMHDVMVKDFNRISGKTYTHSDAYDVNKSKEMCKKLLNHYGKAYKKSTGKEPTNREYAYFWNGGFKRMKSPNNNVKVYWGKVESILNKKK